MKIYPGIALPVLASLMLSGFTFAGPAVPEVQSTIPAFEKATVSTVAYAGSLDALTSVSVPKDVKFEINRGDVTSKPAPKKEKKVEKKTEPKAEAPAQEAVEAPQPAQEEAPAPVQETVQAQPAPEPTYSKASVPSASGSKVVDIAAKYVGAPYVWGGTSPSGWDCSGYVQYVFKEAGINLPRVNQWVGKQKISQSEAKPGDLVVQNGGSHVGIYAGNGMMYSALNPADGTQLHETKWMPAEFYRM